jgi:capsule polysaccharide export protein KpsE/RkpR
MPLSEQEPRLAPSQRRTRETIDSARPIVWSDWMVAAERLWYFRTRLLVFVLLGGIVSGFLCFFIPKYESTAQIMPPDSSPSGLAALALPALSKMPGLAGLASDLLGTKNSTAVFMKILESRTVQDDLIARFDLRKHYNIRYWEDTRKKLDSRTTISEDKKSGIISLAVRDRDPQFASTLAAAYVEELDKVVARVSTSSARRERIFIEQRLNEQRALLDDSERKFSRFASSTMALDVPEQTKVSVEAAAKLQGELIAVRSQLEGLQQIYTGENYRVKVLRARAAELERSLAKMNSGALTTGGAQDPANPYPSVKSLPVLGVEWVDLYRTNKVNETVFELLTQQYEMAKIQEAREIPTVKVLDPPSTPEKRYPRPWMLLIGGLLGGLTVGCTETWARDAWAKWDPEDHRRIFLSRVLLHLSGSPTPESGHAQAERNGEPPFSDQQPHSSGKSLDENAYIDRRA